MAINKFEIQTFDRMNPNYSHFERVGDWWKEITGKEPRECPGITIGIPVFNEAKSIRRVILKEILEQRLPKEVPITIICATDGSTDRSPAIIQSIIDELAEEGAKKEGGGKRKEDFIRREQFVWPHEELVDQYQKQHWPEDEFGLTIQKTTIQTGDGVTLIHIFNPRNQGKNNTMNIIRAHTNTPEVIFTDGDVRLHPYAIGELYGAMVKQDDLNRRPIVPGGYIPYWDIKPFWAKYTQGNLNDLPGIPLCGGLFIMETASKTIPYFPVDLMGDDKWLRLFYNKHFKDYKQAEKALGFFKRPGNPIDQIREVLRWRFHEVQLYSLHKDDLPEDFLPKVLGRSIRKRIEEFDGKLASVLDILSILAAKKMVLDFKKSGKPWYELRSFKRVSSSK